MKVGYLLIGRLKSTRLPKKLLLDIKGKPIISHLLDRLKLANKINQIIICTSNLDQDKQLAKIAKENGVECFFGDPDDVLLRMLEAANHYNLDYILNITADCPFVDPNYADAIVDMYKDTNADLIRQFDLPHGVFSYGIKVEALKKIIKIKDTSETEVWGRYFTDTGLFNVQDFKVINKFHKRPNLRMTLDYAEDLDFFKSIFNALYKKGSVFSLDDILKFLDANPHIVNINKECGNKFLKKFKKQSEIKLKKMKKVSNALILGCGSIGQRHIKNLKSIGVKSIYALRSRKGYHKNLDDTLDVLEIENWNEVAKLKPDIAIISNPTSLHLETAIKLSPHVKGIFMEKPLSNSLEGVDKLKTEIKNNKNVFFMGHNLMFHPIIKNIKEFINSNELGKILNIQCQVGQWLPDWHPYEDYKKAYFAKKDLGGGVALTLIHEIHLAIELAGKPLEVCGMKSVSSLLNLESDIDVISDTMIKHESGCISQIHMDYIQKPMHRSGTITFERGWASYDFNENKIIIQISENTKPEVLWSDNNYDVNKMYLKQLECFINYVEEHRISHSYDINGGIESLWVVESLSKSDKQKEIIINQENNKFSL